MQNIIKIIILLILIFFPSKTACSETAKDRYIQRIKDEISHNYKMKELDLQYKVYCKELELQKEDIIINNTNTNVRRNYDKTKTYR